jgi:hypothetical protein
MKWSLISMQRFGVRLLTIVIFIICNQSQDQDIFSINNMLALLDKQVSSFPVKLHSLNSILLVKITCKRKMIT